MNSFGVIFRISIFGESHGPAIGVIIDGCPPGIAISEGDFMHDLARRQSGAAGTTKRHEPDLPEILSGVHNGFTTGSPLAIQTRNKDKISSDYSEFKNIPRPGHADFTAQTKYSGFSDLNGSGHFSGRITWGLVAAGVVAKKICSNSTVTANLTSAGGSADIQKAINDAVAVNDSIGGIIECRITNPPMAIGEPFFNSIESVISQLIFSIPAIKGVEFGAGFASAAMKGSDHNDPIIDEHGKRQQTMPGELMEAYPMETKYYSGWQSSQLHQRESDRRLSILRPGRWRASKSPVVMILALP
jgi:chorismate synthase